MYKYLFKNYFKYFYNLKIILLVFDNFKNKIKSFVSGLIVILTMLRRLNDCIHSMLLMFWAHALEITVYIIRGASPSMLFMLYYFLMTQIYINKLML